VVFALDFVGGAWYMNAYNPKFAIFKGLGCVVFNSNTKPFATAKTICMPIMWSSVYLNDVFRFPFDSNA